MVKIYPTGAIKNLISIDELPNGGYIVTGENKGLRKRYRQNINYED